MNDLPKQKTGSPVPVLATIYGPALLFLILTILANWYRNIPFEFFSRDPATIAKTHPLAGVQSNLGVLIWWAGGAICLFGQLLLRRTGAGKPFATFFLWSGIITFILTLDDFLLFHEDLAWRYLRVNEKLVYVAYLMLCVWYLIKFREIILGSKWLFLFAAFVFFGLSMIVDIFQNRWQSPWRIFLEDGFKLLGIVSWSGYLIRTCFQTLDASMNTRADSNAGIP